MSGVIETMTRRAAFTCWLLFGVWVFIAFALGRSNLTAGTLLDFASFWAAGKLVLAGTPALAWDMSAHAAVMATALGAVNGLMPFPYPPPMLLLVTPFALTSYSIAFILWVLATFAFYLWQTRRFAPPALAAAQPAVLINFLIGQNGFLTSGILLGGAERLSRRPFTAGLIFGVLIIKPQLAMMLPVAMVAGRHWRAVAGAVVSAVSLLLSSWLLFGWASYVSFAELLPVFTGWMAEGRFDLTEFASVFAFGQIVGLEHGPAMSLHIVIAIGAAVACWHTWWKDTPAKVAVLCAASLLASPYLQAYDTLAMVAPVGFLAKRRPWQAVILFAMMLLAVGTQSGLWTWPNLTPIAAILAIWWCGQSGAVRADPR